MHESMTTFYNQKVVRKMLLLNTKVSDMGETVKVLKRVDNLKKENEQQ